MPSTVVAKMDYHHLRRTLKIVFTSGLVYEYINVPPEVYEAMKNAPSKGTYLNQEIKPNFDYRQLS